MTRVVYFAPDLAEASQIKAAEAMRAAGAEVTSFSFRRANMAPARPCGWRDISLGRQGNGQLARRALDLWRVLPRVLRHRRTLRAADVWVARNMDMACLAAVARRLTGAEGKLVYQCLDIHGIFAAQGWRGAVARWCERRLLAEIDRLAISAPAFQSDYFGPVQGYGGTPVLIENKIFWPDGAPPRPAADQRVPGPLRLGWVGTLRCPASFELLLATADRLGTGIEMILRGVVHRHMLPDLERRISHYPNVRFEGGYGYPDGLAWGYRDLDLVWAQDMWQPGSNSDWLLPNRIYEAGFFGCGCVALRGTATGARVARDGLGLVIDRATPECLAKALSQMSDRRLNRLAADLLSRPAGAFCLTRDEVRSMLNFDGEWPDGIAAVG